jgi:hypothetical protein
MPSAHSLLEDPADKQQGLDRSGMGFSIRPSVASCPRAPCLDADDKELPETALPAAWWDQTRLTPGCNSRRRLEADRPWALCIMRAETKTGKTKVKIADNEDGDEAVMKWPTCNRSTQQRAATACSVRPPDPGTSVPKWIGSRPWACHGLSTSLSGGHASLFGK